MARFEVTLYGQFWVTPEGIGLRIPPVNLSTNLNRWIDQLKWQPLARPRNLR